MRYQPSRNLGLAKDIINAALGLAAWFLTLGLLMVVFEL